MIFFAHILFFLISFLNFTSHSKHVADDDQTHFYCKNLTATINESFNFYHFYHEKSEYHFYFTIFKDDSCSESFFKPRLHIKFITFKENCEIDRSEERHIRKFEACQSKQNSLEQRFIVLKLYVLFNVNHTYLKLRYTKSELEIQNIFPVTFENINPRNIYSEKDKKGFTKFGIFYKMFCGLSIMGRCLTLCYPFSNSNPIVVEKRGKLPFSIINFNGSDDNITGIISLSKITTIPPQKFKKNYDILNTGQNYYIPHFLIIFAVYFPLVYMTFLFNDIRF